MDLSSSRLCTAFAGTDCIASGGLRDVALAAKQRLDAGEAAPILIFDDGSSEQIELDFRGSAEDVSKRFQDDGIPPAPDAESDQPRRRGRPKLGVVPREVTLLPRHWDWLARQPGGASVALRKLVEQASRLNEDKDRQREAQQSAHRFMTAIAGELPNYEEALRALYACDSARFGQCIGAWPEGLRGHLEKLAGAAFG